MVTARYAFSALMILMLTLGSLTQAGQMPDCMDAAATVTIDHAGITAAVDGGGGCDRPWRPMTKSMTACHGMICMAPIASADMRQIPREPHTRFAVPRNTIPWHDSGPAPETHPPRSA